MGHPTSDKLKMVTHICMHPDKKDLSKICGLPVRLNVNAAVSNRGKHPWDFGVSFQNSNITNHNARVYMELSQMVN